MTSSRYDPFREALNLRQALDQLFERSFIHPSTAASPQITFTPMNVYETDQSYQVEVSLPGVKPEDIDLMVHENILDVRGLYSSSIIDTQQPQQNQSTTPIQHQGQDQNLPQAQGQQGNWLMREMRSGMFERTVTFARPIDSTRVQARHEHGVLIITLPVRESSRPRSISIQNGQNQLKQITVGSEH